MKIAFIGAGSGVFTLNLTRDILSFPRLQDCTISLMDIDETRLYFAGNAVRRIVELGGYDATVQTTLSRENALAGAEVVLVMINAHSVEVWRNDIEIPKQYGVDINVGDTRGPAGIFRFLRTAPILLGIAEDMERLCPRAVLLNYSNPMAMLCQVINHTTDVTVTGLCHSVQGTAHMLARWIGASMDEITYQCAGINHMAWYLSFERNGQDAYPEIRNAIIENSETYTEEIVRNEMFLALGKYVTESSGHASEYNPWFRKRADLIERYCLPGTGWNPGEHAYVLNATLREQAEWEEKTRQWLASDNPISLERGEEYAAYIINALAGHEPFCFNGNVENDDLIDNLPSGCCVEVPVWAHADGLDAVRVGALPSQCAALTSLTATTEMMAVEASLTGNPELVYQAICFDPLTSAVLSLSEIRDMVNEMFAANESYLPQFTRHRVRP